MIYIGDVSKQDYEVLAFYALKSQSIIEFGCGASTQILRHYCPGSVVRSVDTVPLWIERTKHNLELLGITAPVEFYNYGEDPQTPGYEYDFVFSDGLPELRFDFALKHWDLLRPGGWLAFHDTRRDHDFHLALQLMLAKNSEVETAEFNKIQSNITVITKRLTPLLYENWNEVEGRKPWQFGHAAVDVDELRAMQLWEQKQ